VNKQFASVFPRQVDMESGAVSFHPSEHVIGDKPSSEVHAVECPDRKQEAEYMIARIRHELASDLEQSIAILVRSRSQLPSIINLLREHQIPYQGTDIDLLAHLMHLRDVWSMTQALLMPGNRLSWLAALRSPYGGLELCDIHAIAQVNRKNSIYSALLDLDNIPDLSDEGRIRARFFIEVMQEALAARCQIHVSDWVNNTLKKLHINQLLNPQQLDDLEQFWALLDRYEEQGRLSNIKEFEGELNHLYSQQTSPSRLQIMTIHKSKGLEFDTVFLPSLGSQPNSADKPMLRWLKLPTEHEDILLVSPVKGAHQEDCPLYDYLGKLDEEKSHYESQRLLYVAVTRAKTRLYLLDGTGKTSKKSFRGLLNNQEFTHYEPEQESKEDTLNLPQSERLPLSFYLSPPQVNQEALNIIPKLSERIPRLTGIVMHRLLQWICDHHPASMDELPWPLVTQECTKLGFSEDTISLALNTMHKQLKQLFCDTIGLWIIAPHHNEHNEYELLVERNNVLATRIIDRTFEDQNQLWIIDFKTGKEDPKTQQRYQEQLNEYASYLSTHTSLPIHCGLYYLDNNHWVHWQYIPLTL
jgi:ATP-dependent exoDNAse (exonuclease V) beta subunit